MWFLSFWQHSGSEWKTCVSAWHRSVRPSELVQWCLWPEHMGSARPSWKTYHSHQLWSLPPITNECSLAQNSWGNEDMLLNKFKLNQMSISCNIFSMQFGMWECVFESSFLLSFQRRAACRPGVQHFFFFFYFPYYYFFLFLHWLATHLNSEMF